ncbi:MAG: class I SAM-dependent methyltransferase [Verrucomicrobiota bacterium]
MKKSKRLYPPLTDASYLVLTDMRKIIAGFAAAASGVVIDYGAGSKPYQSLFPATVRYRGADFYAEGPDEIRITDPKHLPVDDAVADWVVSFQVLEHVEDPLGFLKECRRVVRPGGTLLLSTHGIWPYHTGGNCGDYYRWTGSGLTLLVKQAGFDSVVVHSATTGWRGILQQALAMKDPARQPQSWLVKQLKRLLNLAVNVFAEIINPICRNYNDRADILPIVYVLKATAT